MSKKEMAFPCLTCKEEYEHCRTSCKKYDKYLDYIHKKHIKGEL
jgi:hypothetical protein